MTIVGRVRPLQCAPRANFRLEYRPANQPGALACWLAVPDHADPAAPPLVAVHGIRRGADEQASLFASRAAASGRYVIAPFFDKDNWPTYQRLGGASRSDLALLSLLEQLRQERVAGSGEFDLFGFSAGAQFAHRFAMLHPEMLRRLYVASAGWYTFPDGAAYPYGLGERAGRATEMANSMQDKLEAFLRLPIRVCVGARDNVRDANTRSGWAIDQQQGPDRLTRASRWAEAVRSASAARGIMPRVTLSVLPGVGHDFRKSMTRGGLGAVVLPVPANGLLHRGASLLDGQVSRRSMFGWTIFQAL